MMNSTYTPKQIRKMRKIPDLMFDVWSMIYLQ